MNSIISRCGAVRKQGIVTLRTTVNPLLACCGNAPHAVGENAHLQRPLGLRCPHTPKSNASSDWAPRQRPRCVAPGPRARRCSATRTQLRAPVLARRMQGRAQAGTWPCCDGTHALLYRDVLCGDGGVARVGDLVAVHLVVNGVAAGTTQLRPTFTTFASGTAAEFEVFSCELHIASDVPVSVVSTVSHSVHGMRVGGVREVLVAPVDDVEEPHLVEVTLVRIGSAEDAEREARPPPIATTLLRSLRKAFGLGTDGGSAVEDRRQRDAADILAEDADVSRVDCRVAGADVFAAASTGFTSVDLTERQRVLLADHIKGMLYGNCIGDAVGLSTEFMTPQLADQLYGRDELRSGTYEYRDMVIDDHRNNWLPGDWTDDSDQMLLLLRSLVACGGRILPADFGRRLLAWSRAGFPELGDETGNGLGATVFSVLNHPAFTLDPVAASLAVWNRSGRSLAANGAVMRTAVTAVPHWNSLERVECDTVGMARVTHADPRSIASCVAVTGTLARLLQHFVSDTGEDPDVDAIAAAAIAVARKQLVQDDGAASSDPGAYSHDAAAAQLDHFLMSDDLEQLELCPPDMHGIGFTYRCAGAGFWALRSGLDFRRAIGCVAAEAGDADTNAAVAGALVGCRLGYSVLERQAGSWLRDVPPRYREFLDSHVDMLLTAMDLPTSRS